MEDYDGPSALSRERLGAFYLLLSVLAVSLTIWWLVTIDENPGERGWVIALLVFLGLWFIVELFMLFEGLRKKGLNRQGLSAGFQGVYEVG